MSRILEERSYYKPFMYPWAFRGYKEQIQLDWTVEEVPLHEDVDDWQNKITPGERSLLTHIFRFFTQGDVDIAAGYHDMIIPHFKHPELRMMLGKFASMESTHIEAYSLLLDTVGMPETEFSAFLEYKEMKDKHEYLFKQKCRHNSLKDLALNLAVFSAFGEGLQLFSSFVMLLNFQRFNRMKGMCQLVSWSIRDESLHVEYMLRLFKTLVAENPELWTESFQRDLYEVCETMVHLEDRFIELAFEAGEVRGMHPQEIKDYVRLTADQRLHQLGLKPIYHIDYEPIPKIRSMISAVEHANFFETRATEYSKNSMEGNWNQVWGGYKPASNEEKVDA